MPGRMGDTWLRMRRILNIFNAMNWANFFLCMPWPLFVFTSFADALLIRMKKKGGVEVYQTVLWLFVLLFFFGCSMASLVALVGIYTAN